MYIFLNSCTDKELLNSLKDKGFEIVREFNTLLNKEIIKIK